MALSAAIKGIRDRGGIAVVIAHRPSALAHIDKVMAMAGGQVQAFGPKEEVLRKVLAPVPAAPKPEPGAAQQAPMVSAIRRGGGPELRLEAN